MTVEKRAPEDQQFSRVEFIRGAVAPWAKVNGPIDAVEAEEKNNRKVTIARSRDFPGGLVVSLEDQTKRRWEMWIPWANVAAAVPK